MVGGRGAAGPPTASNTRRSGCGVQTARSLNADVTTTRI